jgi:hypothetical protein
MTSVHYATTFSQLLEKYIVSERMNGHGSKWWGFMSELEILQFAYLLCNIPYYPDESQKFFSDETKIGHPGRGVVRTRQHTVKRLAPLFDSVKLIAPEDQSTFPYCTYLIVKDVIFVCVRGTTLTQDWGINANAFMDTDKGIFHKGFYDNAMRGIEQVQQTVEQYKLAFTKAVFVGHSMGAATASIMSYLYKKRNPEKQVESLVLSCPKFCDFTKSRRKWAKTVPRSLHMYTTGDVTPTIIVGFLTRPFAKENEIKLCLPVAISKDGAYGVSSHLMYIGTALHKNYYNNMHIIGAYHEYPYIKYLCVKSETQGNIIGAPMPFYEKNGKVLEEKECKAIKSQAMTIYRHFKAGAGAELLAHTIVAVGSVIANILGYLSIPPKGFKDLLPKHMDVPKHQRKGGAVPMFTRDQLLQILGKGTEIALGQMQPETGEPLQIPLTAIGAVQTYILEALAVAQTGKRLDSDEVAIMITHYLNLLNSGDEGSSGASVSSAHSSEQIAEAAPMSASRDSPLAKKQRIAGGRKRG